MQIEDQRPIKLQVIEYGDKIEMGQVFTGTIGTHTGAFLRAYFGIVSLDRPNSTWGNVSLHTVRVIDYEPRDAKIVLLP